MKTLLGVVLLSSAVIGARADVIELSFSGIADATINSCILQPYCAPSQILTQQPFTLGFFGDSTILSNPLLSQDQAILGGFFAMGNFFGTLPTLAEAPDFSVGGSLLRTYSGGFSWYEAQPLYSNASFFAPELVNYNYDSNITISDVTMGPEQTVRGPGGFLYNGNQVLLSNWSTLSLTATVLTPEPNSGWLAFLAFLGVASVAARRRPKERTR